MPLCFLVSDLHGNRERYTRLFESILRERPAGVFLGGDLLPSVDAQASDYVRSFLIEEFKKLRAEMAGAYPRVFVVPGNDDSRAHEPALQEGERADVWEYAHERRVAFGDYEVFGYAYVPPTPFLLKDWERYDMSRQVDPGCVSPEEGLHTAPVDEHEVRYATIREDLERLTSERDVSQAIMLFHAPPYETALDRAALDGQMVDHVPVDLHVGSVAIRRFIEARQPLLTLHGHIHESARLTGAWRERIGRTWCLSAAHDGPEFALVRFDPDNPEGATRTLI
jgi:Icc-related predicted phosphoesterase